MPSIVGGQKQQAYGAVNKLKTITTFVPVFILNMTELKNK